MRRRQIGILVPQTPKRRVEFLAANTRLRMARRAASTTFEYNYTEICAFFLWGNSGRLGHEVPR
jgi:hypothetical protein